MRVEVQSAADFVMSLLRAKHSKDLTDIELSKFKGSLADLMLIRYQSHWYPEVPTKGSGYRCIRINGKMDPMIEQAGVSIGLQPRVLRKMLPAELTMWIDPHEVAYRIGENGSICVLFDAVQARSSPSSDVESTGSDDSVGRLDISVINYLVDSPNSSKSSSNTSSSSPYVNYHHNNHQYHNTNRYNYRHSNNSNYNNNHQNQHHSYHNQFDNSLYHWDGLHTATQFNNFNSKVRTNC